jgi:serine/threonine protein kinase
MKGVMSKEDADVTLENPRIEGPGTTIGRYKLLELIGEGGMGLVYLAEQQEPIRRRAALKIVKLGMDTKQVIARFEAEKQMLALLDHPNIARVYDAGTTETGRPYFVMEYVKGQSITEYCDQHKTGIEDRLKLFRQVCDAVQYAHQKGIIHRDIKPSNILISIQGDKPVPKIIDFGIAKALTQPLTEGTLFTQQGQLLGTPEYMSPEQTDLATQDIDTRSDIYSLGVVLYQLLAGVLPFGRESFEKGGFAEIQRVIQEVDPPNPSTALSKLGDEAKKIAEKRKTQVVPLARRLHRELEWIPLKAMRKERVRRYRSASELADDIQNYLNGNPLIAGPETAIYRVKKFVRRHAGSVATVALVTVAIVLGLVVSTAMYFRAEQALGREAAARAEAERQGKISQAVADFLTDDFLANVWGWHDSSGDISLPSALGDATASVGDRFKGEPLVEASVREALGKAYRRRGEYKEAQPQMERACQIRREQLGEADPSTLVSMNNLALLYRMQDRYKEAEALFVKTLEGRRRVLGEEHQDTLESMSNLASVYYYQDQYEKAEPLLVKALEISRRVLGRDNEQTQICMGWLAKVYRKQGKNEQAEPLYLEMLDVRRRRYGDEFAEDVTTEFVMKGLIEVYEAWGKPQQADQWRVKLRLHNSTTIHYDSDLDEWIHLMEAWDTTPKREKAKEELPPVVNSMGELAKWYSQKGRYKEAEPIYLEMLEIQRRVLGEEHQDTLASMSGLASVYYVQGQYDKAEPLLTEVLEIRRRVLGEKHEDTLASMKELAGVYYRQGQYGKVEPLATKALEISRRILGEQDRSTLESMRGLAWFQATCPAAEFRNGAEAIKNATKACELTEWKEAMYVDTLAAAYAETGDFESAVKWQKTAISLLTKEDPAEWQAEFEERLKLYESGKPYRESP